MLKKIKKFKRKIVEGKKKWTIYPIYLPGEGIFLSCKNAHEIMDIWKGLVVEYAIEDILTKKGVL